MSISNIPTDLIVTIALKLDITSVRSLCRTCKKFHYKLYHNDVFWMLKFKLNIGYYEKCFYETWRKYYKLVLTKPPLRLILDGVMRNRKDMILIGLDSGIILTSAIKNNCLTWASTNGDLDIIKRLIFRVGYPEARYLFIACKKGHLNIVEYFMGNWVKGEFARDTNVAKERALSEAVTGGHINVVKYLVGKGIDPRPKYSYLLMWSKGHTEVNNYLKSIVGNK